MVNYNDSSRTLSGIDERSIVSLSLPSSVAAISIGGNVGTAGQVIAKNNITNKLEWDAVDDITIPDHSIVGDKLALDISFTTSGNISLLNNTVNATLMANVLRYVGFLTGNGNLDLYSNFIGGHRWLAFDYQTNNFTIDNPNNFFVGNVGITDGTPANRITLNQNGTIDSTGNISTAQQLISTKATPTATEYGLDITGNAKIGGNLTVVGDIDLDDILTDELTVKGKAIFQTDPAVATTRKVEIDSSTGAIKQYDNFNPPQQTTFLNILDGEIEAQSLILEGNITQQTPGQVLTTDLQIINGVIDMKQIKQTNQVSPVGNYQVELRGAGKFEKLLGGGVDDQVAVFCDGDLLITGNIVNQAGNIHTVVGEFRVVNAITGNVFNRFRVQPIRDPNAQPTPLIPTVNFLADEIRFNVENNNPNVANPLMLFMDLDVATTQPRLLSEGTFTIHKGIDIGSADFSKTNRTEIIAAQVNETTKLPTNYAIKARGRIRSGELKVEYFPVGEYTRYPKFTLSDNFITEIVDIFDSAGNRYFEVDYLSQDTVYAPVTNRNEDSDNVPYLMKPKVVPRRFITSFEGNRTTIQFGHGSEENITTDVVSDPYNVVMDMHGKDHVTDKAFDPTNLIETDSLGVAPSDTTLTVIYRSNTTGNVNISSNSLESIVDVDIRFQNANTLDSLEVKKVIASLEFENENPIVGSVTPIGAEEIKQRAYGLYAAQNRAVTKEDYKAIIYKMPPKFGSISKCSLVQDKDSFKRNLNLYVVSENSIGNFITTPETLKNNLKTWLSNYKMINDTIDILDGKIVNIGIEYEIIVDKEENRFSALDIANRVLATRFSRKFEFGEPLLFSDIFQALKNIPNVLDVGEVKITKKTGALYSSVDFSIEKHTNVNGRIITPPDDFVFEIKTPSSDIRGTVI